MARAQGARAQMALGFESAYGTPPAAGDFWRMPFVSSNLGAEQPLSSSELLGYGRDPLAPVKDAITVDGDVVDPDRRPLPRRLAEGAVRRADHHRRLGALHPQLRVGRLDAAELRRRDRHAGRALLRDVRGLRGELARLYDEPLGADHRDGQRDRPGRDRRRQLRRRHA